MKVKWYSAGWAFWGAWYAFLGFHLVHGLESAGAPDMLAVVYLLPNVLRTFCLHFVSSNMHY